MTQAVADTQALSGEGVASLRALLNEVLLKALDQPFLAGDWMTLASAIQALTDALNALKHIATSTHPAGKWSILVPTKLVKALYFQIVRVPGVQGRIGEAESLEEQTRIEKAKGAQAQQWARELHEGMLTGTITTHEQRLAFLSKTGDREAVMDAYQAMVKGAPWVSDGNRVLPSFDVPPGPKTLAVEKGYHLLVKVKGGVDEVHGTARVTVQRPLDGDPTFADCFEMQTINCSAADHWTLQLHQLMNEPLEVHLTGEAAVVPRRGVQSYRLSLGKAVPRYTEEELIRRALLKTASLFDESQGIGPHP